MTTYSNMESFHSEDNFSIHNFVEIPRNRNIERAIEKDQIQGMRFQENDLKFECKCIFATLFLLYILLKILIVFKTFSLGTGFGESVMSVKERMTLAEGRKEC